MIISIDGPSGAGKSTLGKMLAKEYGLLYLDTGAMYRAVALSALDAKIDLQDADKVNSIADQSMVELKGTVDDLRIVLDGEDVTVRIRTPEVAEAASVVSTNSKVRRMMVEHQRRLGKGSTKGCVLEGRDIGSVVFPDAEVKFFLTARPEARARRRFEEYSEKGEPISYEATLADILARDERDVSRSDSPLTIPENAIVIDTSELSLTEVFELMRIRVDENQAALNDSAGKSV